jgi:acetyltransferase-like isoleucine patch superfamily enzyme
MRSPLWLLRNTPRVLGYWQGPRLMSWLRKRWVLLRNAHAEVRFGRGTYLGPGFSLHMPYDDGSSFIAGNGVEFRRGFRAEVVRGGRIEIGDGTVFTYDVLMQCSRSIEIGERCTFAEGVVVVDANHRFRDPGRPLLDQGYDHKEVRIADDATVMSKCTVFASIGEHAFVGANSVVSRPVPAYTLALGAPARPVDYFGAAGAEPDELRARMRE